MLVFRSGSSKGSGQISYDYVHGVGQWVWSQHEFSQKDAGGIPGFRSVVRDVFGVADHLLQIVIAFPWFYEA